MNFKEFYLEQSETDKDIEKTLRKIPKNHRNLIKGYKFKWEIGNALKNHNGHVGIINPNTKSITIAAPWRYSRQHTFIHELAHKVWEAYVAKDAKLLNKWKTIVKNTKNKPNQNAEELFAHSYAQAYCDNPIEKFAFPKWISFIKELPK